MERVLAAFQQFRIDQNGMFRALSHGNASFYYLNCRCETILDLRDIIQGLQIKFVESMAEATAIKVDG